MSAQAPHAGNPGRLTWGEVPDAVVAAIGKRAGSRVESVAPAELGFSPGFAGVVGFEDGSHLFLKVISSAQHPHSSTFNRREAEVVAQLPAGLSVPRFHWELDIAEWYVLAFEAIDGVPARPHDDSDHEAAVWVALTELAAVPAPSALPAFHDYQSDVFAYWRELADAPRLEERLAGYDAEWILAHLDDLIRWEAQAVEATRGDRLVHGDVRADNMLIAQGRAFIVDWPHASAGAPWLDLAGYLPSHEMHGGGTANEGFRAHPLGRNVPAKELRAFVASLAGYFVFHSTAPEPDHLPGLRAFQRAQALPSLRWLRELA